MAIPVTPIIQLIVPANFSIRLTTSNYWVWQKPIQSALIGLALEGYIDGTTTAPSKYVDATQTTLNPAYLAWYMQDLVILNAILGSCTGSIQPTISYALTSKAAWDRLKESFASPCRTRIVSLKSKLASCNFAYSQYKNIDLVSGNWNTGLTNSDT
ncbi:PREDICTED: uncharacterized protein LOC109156155 [Ipomoea nil]|uniref:uncharacterized protein LOC109156155 n=1 Tax=Ipomoea nil TaxID=35883 RepID=UPI0009017176|nr:PREDICTED: uncharacterized protein LOC109156155 [Ipomoea nil]